MKFIVHTDGGSRNNPGPAALGVVIADEQGKLLKQYGEYLGERTNNEAEYMAVISALRKIRSLWGKEQAKHAEVHVFADSQLLVRQLCGEYKIENSRIQPLFLELWNLKVDFAKVIFSAIPREQNKEADRQVNEALDKAVRTNTLFS